MFNDRTKWFVACAMFLTLLSWVLPGVGVGAAKAEGPQGLDTAPILGLTPPKLPGLRVISVRDARFSGTAIKSADGDTYDAAGLVQDANAAYYVDDFPDNHTFGTGEESAGVNLISMVDTRIVGTDLGPGLPDTNFLQVNYFTADGSDIVPAGTVSPAELIFDSWRFDVGTEAAGTDKINWTPSGSFTVVDSGFCLADAGEVLGCFDLAVHDSDATGLSGIGLLGLGGGDIAGYGVDEMIMYWEIQAAAAPACGDGHVDPGEECDDGNTVDGDGCSAACQDEAFNPADFDEDGDVDLDDYATFQREFTGL